MAPILRSVFALLSILSASLVNAQDTQIPLECQEGVQVIAVVGANVVNGTQSYGLTFTFVQDIMADIPNSSNFSVNYNRFHNQSDTSKTFIPEVCEGVPELYEAIYNYTTACPDTPVVLHGYSEGAVVVMNLLCGASSSWFPQTKPLSSSFASHIIAVILYGDETRTANQSYNLGGCESNAPFLARHNPAGCDAFASSMQSFCFENDVDCCGTANASAPYPYGINPHYLYPAGYDNTAVAFVLNQYAEYKNGTQGKSSTTTSTTSTSTSSSSTSSTITSTTTTSTSTSSSSTSTSPTPTSTSTSSSSSDTSTTPTPSSFNNTITSTEFPSTSTLTTLTTTTTTSNKTMTVQATCTLDRCLSSFAAHPTSASRYCNSLASATTSLTQTPWPTMCAGNYSSRVSSACACLMFSTAATTTTATA